MISRYSECTDCEEFKNMRCHIKDPILWCPKLKENKGKTKPFADYKPGIAEHAAASNIVFPFSGDYDLMRERDEEAVVKFKTEATFDKEHVVLTVLLASPVMKECGLNKLVEIGKILGKNTKYFYRMKERIERKRKK